MEEKLSYKQIAKNHNVSSTTVIRLSEYISFTNKPKLPEVLGIDEFKDNTDREKYQCILTDIKNRYVLDILPDRRKYNLSSYFRRYSLEERKKVKVFVADMWKDYKDVAHNLFPNAEIIADKYHWVRQSVWAVDRVRKRVQKAFPKNKCLHFKRNKVILISEFSKLKTDDRIVLEYMLNQNTDLYNAWELKEMFYKLKRSKTEAKAKENMHTFVISAESLQIPEFEGCVKVLLNWGTPIVNSLKLKYSNGYTEGMNNNIKVLKRIAYGYQNFNHFRNRILMAYGKKTA